MKPRRYKLPGDGLLNQSGMMAFLACNRKYAYTYIDRLPRVFDTITALDRGSAFHLLAETRGEARADAQRKLSHDPFETARVFLAYDAYKAQEDAGMMPPLTLAEQRVVSEEHQFYGTIDGIGVDDATGKWWLGEIKTTERFDPIRWQTLEINFQIALYTEMAKLEFAHEQFLSAADFTGVSYRTVEFSSRKPLKGSKQANPRASRTRPPRPGEAKDAYKTRLKTDETAEEFRERIKNDAKVFHKMVSTSDEARLSALQSFGAVKEAIDRLGTKSSNYVKNPGNCFSFGRPCEFFAACWGISVEEQKPELDVENDLDEVIEE